MADIQKATKAKVKTFLKTIYGKYYKDIVIEMDDAFVVRRGSAAVHVSIRPMGRDDCIVRAMSYVVTGAKITPRLMNYLMRLNYTNPIGAYGMMFDDTITFSHAIAGANLDMNELRKTIGTVAFIADETDDEIRRLAGGMRAVDANANIIGDQEAPKVEPAPTPAKKGSTTRKAPVKAPATKKVAKKK